MSSLKKLLRSNFLIRLTNWEYWPFGIVQFPFFLYWLWLSLRARSIFFFSASNPTITMGGMLGESKFDVLKLIPDQYKPKTIFVEHAATKDQVLDLLHQHHIELPVIFKPDIGERGFMVKRIFTESDIEVYLKKIQTDFLIQELVDLPVECGVFYTRFPDEKDGQVTSVVLKEMLTVTGNGTSTLQELILDKPRAKLQLDVLRETHRDKINLIIAKDQIVELNAIGNHCLGTKFLSGEHLINEKLSKAFDVISKQIDGFYFGRFDLRCANVEDLYLGKVKIMELNGCGAEPAHIYHPGFSLWKALRVLATHWHNMFVISSQNHKRGVPYISFQEGKQLYQKFKMAVP
ncbi:MAG TPA: hypothetical protein VFU05_11100 [Cyclobacteriaceae bacterium]|nr:hypothetical protein [Cyclobacteriaceae bacterium]